MEVVYVDMPADGGPTFHPALALDSGYLIVSSEAGVLRTCIDASRGKARRLADTPAFASATAELGRKNAGFWLLDWPLLMDQIGDYASRFGGLAGSPEVKFPDFPDDGDADEWKRRMDAFEAAQKNAQRDAPAKVRRWIDSLRVIDYIASSTHAGPGVSDATYVVKFAE